MNKPIREGFVAEEEVDVIPPVEPAQPEPPPPEELMLVEKWPITVRLLNKPLRVPGKSGLPEDLHELTFREPTGGDINRVGNPVRIDLNGEILIDDRRMMLMMTALSGILTPLLERMDPRDYASCAYRLRNFFLPNLAAW